MRPVTRFHVLLMLSVLLCAFALIMTNSLTTVPAGAQALSTGKTQAATTNTVTVLVLDMSGSMAQNDPDGLRCSAANAYIDLSGPGNFIGVIGLDNSSGARGGPHQFQRAQVWTQPLEMATLAERHQLQQIIATRSNNCRPDSDTPTYDALNQALQMLKTATNGGKVPGSVILLTDGVPDPDTIPQMNAIQSDLLPQFKQHGWPIDTIALGADGPVPGTQTTFHKFLGGLSDATSGDFYDDGHGIVSGISPLNIADFFVNIFALRNHRIVQNDIPPTSLNGGTTRRNFSVTDYTNNLDVVVVKDQAATRASLITPGGHVINKGGSGVFISSFDPHYEIFSIDQPQSGQWELDVTGSGQFLMDSLKVSGIGLSSINISQSNLFASSAVALGQPLTVSANLTYNGQAITDNRFTLSGTITYKGAAGQYSQPFSLDDKSIPGTYVGNVVVPSSAPPGTYAIVIKASTVSMIAVVASRSRQVRIELFPIPVLTATKGTAIQWDPALRTLYSPSFWPLSHLAAWALGGIPAQGDANISGEVQLQQQPYQAAAVTASASDPVSHATIPVTVINDEGGHFHILFPSSTAGTYLLTFKTSGSFEDSHGDFGTTQNTVQVGVIPATAAQEARAWAYTAFYLLCLLFLCYLLRWMITPHPRGAWQRRHDGEMIDSFEFQRALRYPWQGFFHRDILTSRQARMPAGLRFRFQRGGGIQVRADGRESERWERGDGSAVSRDFREVGELRYQPEKTSDEDEDDYTPAMNGHSAKNARVQEDESSTFTFTGQIEKEENSYYDNDEELGGRHNRGGRHARSDDDEIVSSRRTGKQKGRADLWDDEI